MTGLPAEFDFPPLDPFFYEYQKGEFKTSEVYGEIIASNFTLYGLADMRFEAVRAYFSDDTFFLQIDFHVPTSIEAQGTCEGHGTYIGLQMNIKGMTHTTKYFDINLV